MNLPILPEQLIRELTIENEKLKTDLLEAENHIKDFEVLAREWKRGYEEMKSKLEIKIKHLEQTNEDLNETIRSLEYSIQALSSQDW